MTDELEYTYATDSNKLMKVKDHSNSATGFKDGANIDNDYAYDANANMISDKNKGITSIKYNHLNLPTEILWSSSKKINYIYNAAGQKIEKKVTNLSEMVTTRYLDGFQYVQDTLRFFPQPEGYVKNTVVSGQNTFDYVYYYTDHLGNIRLSYAKDPTTGNLKILEENHYYPFGLKHSRYAPLIGRMAGINNDTDKAIQAVDPNDQVARASLYKYKYNGKEFQDELGLGWYDYQARNYDPALGRWMNVDPHVEVSRRHSPYTYVYNNPLRFIDPDGKIANDVIISGNKSKYAVKELQKAVNGELIITRNKETGKITATPVKGKTLSPKSEKLLEATTDSSIKVRIIASNSKFIINEKTNMANFGGSFMGADVSPTKVVDGKKQVESKQAINPELLSQMTKFFGGSKGADVLHETLEPYIAGKMVQISGVSSGNSNTAGSVYDDAHDETSKVAPQSKDIDQGNKIIPIIDNNGEIQRIELQNKEGKSKTIWSL